MTSSTTRGGSRSPPPPDTRRPPKEVGSSAIGSSRVKRHGKSSDRLHRLGGGNSSTHLHGGKRSKSHTQLAAAGGGPTAQTTPKKQKKKGGAGSAVAATTTAGGTQGRGYDEEDDGSDDVDETGWTSAADSTHRSVEQSPAISPDEGGAVLQRNGHHRSEDEDDEEDEDDGVLVMGRGKKRPPQQASKQHQQTSTDAAQQPPSMTRTDTSATLVADPASTTSVSSNATTTRDATQSSSPPSTSSTRPSAPDSPSQVSSQVSAATPRRQSGSGHLRISSSASNRTLTGSIRSMSSRTSLRPPSMMCRDNLAAPMLSTHNALAGQLGSQQERRQDDDRFVAATARPKRHASLGIPPSASEPWQLSERARPQSGLPPGSSSELHDEPTDSTTERDRRRTESTRSLTAADAAKLAAKLRQARDAMDASGVVGMGRTGSSSGGGASGGGYAASGGATSGQAGWTRSALPNKPVASIFAKEQERRGKPVAVTVDASSVYSSDFTRAVLANSKQRSGSKLAAAAATASDSASIRYVGLYGLGGPPIEKTPLNDALLAPSFDGDEFEASLAPALANAAGLGAADLRRGMHATGTSSELIEDGTPFHDPTMGFSGSAAVNGPNATPVHLIHGLTAISPEAFPLDPADAPSLETDHRMPLLADPATLRAIALTSQVLSTHRSHSMTRRYFDPMREGLDRSMRPGRAKSGGGNSNKMGNRGSMSTPLAGHTGSLLSSRDAGSAATAPSSPRSGSGSSSSTTTRRGRSSMATTTTMNSSQSHSNLNLSAMGENPMQSLKRVWSSTGSALTRGASGQRGGADQQQGR